MFHIRNYPSKHKPILRRYIRQVRNISPEAYAKKQEKHWWSISALRDIPLSAEYSKNDYGGDRAFRNPLFIKTNRILTAAWGVLYLLTPIWTYFIMRTDARMYIGLINSILPAIMGVFTARFQKWYPQKIASGSSK